MKMKSTKDILLARAKRDITLAEHRGEDYQQALWEILNNPNFAPLFEGLNEQEHDDLCNEISLGLEDE